MNNDISDVSYPDFWNNCYNTQDTGWDLSAPTPIFVDWCNNIDKKNQSICVPGSGNGYDPFYFASKGHSVTAIDFADMPISHLKEESKKNGFNLKAIKQDIFNLDSELNNTFDYIVEYTCYCAINPKMRRMYIDVMYDLLKEGGEFVGILLPLNKKESEGGPPFGVELNETIDMLSEKFNLIESIQHHLSIEPRKGNEQFVRFIK